MMKNKTPTKIMKFFAIFLLLLIFTSQSFHVFANSVIDEKDGIILDVSISDENGRKVVSCTLTNKSDDPICSASLAYRHVFYVKLLDEDGIEILPDAAWAESFAQKSSKGYQRQKITSVFQVDPSESLNWRFYLDDAYSAADLDKADQLNVSWESMYAGTDTDLNGNPYEYPADWKASVSIPLTGNNIDNPSIADNNVNDTARAINDNDNTETTKQNNDNSSIIQLLWILALILMATLLVVATTKKKKKA